MVGFCIDGASNTTGKFKGLTTLLRQTVGPHLQTFHCMAHRLELAINGTVHEVNPVGHLQIFRTVCMHFTVGPPKTKEN